MITQSCSSAGGSGKVAWQFFHRNAARCDHVLCRWMWSTEVRGAPGARRAEEGGGAPARVGMRLSHPSHAHCVATMADVELGVVGASTHSGENTMPTSACSRTVTAQRHSMSD